MDSVDSIKWEVFELLKSGKIISNDSSKKEYRRFTNFLENENELKKFNKNLTDIGYEIKGSDGYFYLAKLSKLSEIELERFINRHRKAFLAIHILRELFSSNIPNEISFSKFLHELLQRDDKSIFEHLENLTELKDDYKTMSEKLFSELSNANVIELQNDSNKDRYILLKAINYYLNILDDLELGE